MRERTIEELLEIAQQYGNIWLHQDDRKRHFSCDINFMTDKHISLSAKSGLDHTTAKQAIIEAIKNAEKIVGSMERASQELRNIPKLEHL